MLDPNEIYDLFSRVEFELIIDYQITWWITLKTLVHRFIHCSFSGHFHFFQTSFLKNNNMEVVVQKCKDLDSKENCFHLKYLKT